MEVERLYDVVSGAPVAEIFGLRDLCYCDVLVLILRVLLRNFLLLLELFYDLILLLYHVSLFASWKQRGMYAACICISQLLLVLSKMDLVFSYVTEFYLETLVRH
ncbi:hypothetical protein HanLR1_Chr11g0413021 [Helianthus annuus]|nr:hypothetical protein HanLR1_Chr11g0413021 [Helianthus annuus]